MQEKQDTIKDAREAGYKRSRIQEKQDTRQEQQDTIQNAGAI